MSDFEMPFGQLDAIVQRLLEGYRDGSAFSYPECQPVDIDDVEYLIMLLSQVAKARVQMSDYPIMTRHVIPYLDQVSRVIQDVREASLHGAVLPDIPEIHPK